MLASAFRSLFRAAGAISVRSNASLQFKPPKGVGLSRLMPVW